MNREFIYYLRSFPEWLKGMVRDSGNGATLQGFTGIGDTARLYSISLEIDITV